MINILLAELSQSIWENVELLYDLGQDSPIQYQLSGYE